MSQDLFTEKGAGISACGLYRYWLLRLWDRSKPLICWIMLNPSTADAQEDDPTIRRCMGFSRLWNAGGIIVVNLFAYRATNPDELLKATDPIGPNNNNSLISHTHGKRIIAAWGCHGTLNGRDEKVRELLAGRQLECLGTTKDGHPRHPLYLADKTLPVSLPSAGRDAGEAKR